MKKNFKAFIVGLLTLGIFFSIVGCGLNDGEMMRRKNVLC